MVHVPRCPKLPSLAFQFAYAYTLDGRNVGQATTITTGLLYRFHRGADSNETLRRDRALLASSTVR